VFSSPAEAGALTTTLPSSRDRPAVGYDPRLPSDEARSDRALGR
jgi:hypothetical protein